MTYKIEVTYDILLRCKQDDCFKCMCALAIREQTPYKNAFVLHKTMRLVKDGPTLNVPEHVANQIEQALKEMIILPFTFILDTEDES